MSDRSATKKVKELKLTAMLDVIFLLLIFFILTASFHHNEGILPADLPGNMVNVTPPKEIPRKPVYVQLNKQGQQVAIQLQGHLDTIYDQETFYRTMLEMKSGPYAILDEKHPLIIDTKEDVAWQDFVETFNTLRRAGYADVTPAS